MLAEDSYANNRQKCSLDTVSTHLLHLIHKNNKLVELLQQWDVATITNCIHHLAKTPVSGMWTQNEFATGTVTMLLWQQAKEGQPDFQTPQQRFPAPCWCWVFWGVPKIDQ